MASLRHLLNDEGEPSVGGADVGLGRIAGAAPDSSAPPPTAAPPLAAALVPPLAAMDDAVRAQSRSALHTAAAPTQRPPTAQSAGTSPRAAALPAPALLPADLFAAPALVDVADANPLKRASHDRLHSDVKVRRVSPDSAGSISLARSLAPNAPPFVSAASHSADDELPIDWPPSIAPSSNDFTLLSQPKRKQRKSYANENRYLAPNPLVVQYAGAPALTPISGTVTCSLVDSAGFPITGEFSSALNGATCLPLHGNGRAEFQLKMLATNGGDYLRLRFDVQCEVDGEAKRCVLITDAFRVDTNVRRRVTDRRRKQAATMSAVDDLLMVHGSAPSLLSMSGTLLVAPPVPGHPLSHSASSVLSPHRSANATSPAVLAAATRGGTLMAPPAPPAGRHAPPPLQQLQQQQQQQHHLPHLLLQPLSLASSSAASSTATTAYQHDHLQHDDADDDAIRALAELSVQVAGRNTPP